jgi:hypothetical protein
MLFGYIWTWFVFQWNRNRNHLVVSHFSQIKWKTTGNQATYTAKVWEGKNTSFRKFQELCKTTMQHQPVRVLNSGRCVAFSRPGLDHDLLRDLAPVMWTKTAKTEEKARASKEKAGCSEARNRFECVAVWISNFKTACISDSANTFLYSVLAIYGEALVLWPVIVCSWCNLGKTHDDWQEKKNETFDDEQRILFYRFIISHIPADKALTILRITCC